MQRLLFVVILTIVLIGFPLLVLSDTDTSVADADIPSNEVAGNTNQANNSSVSAAITITMHATDEE